MNHFTVSLVKSAIRVVGYFMLVVSIPLGAVVLIVAELLGILQQVVDKRKEY